MTTRYRKAILRALPYMAVILMGLSLGATYVRRAPTGCHGNRVYGTREGRRVDTLKTSR